MAPTRGGWRELKLALFLKRPLGEPAQPEEWATRVLPFPTARVAYAAVADSETFSARWGPRAGGMGIDRSGPLTVLGDGMNGSGTRPQTNSRPQRNYWISSTGLSTLPQPRKPCMARGQRHRESGPSKDAGRS